MWLNVEIKGFPRRSLSECYPWKVYWIARYFRYVHNLKNTLGIENQKKKTTTTKTKQNIFFYVVNS